MPAREVAEGGEQHDSARCLWRISDVSLFYDDMHVKGPTVGRGKRMTENVLLSLQWRREMFSEFCFLGISK